MITCLTMTFSEKHSTVLATAKGTSDLNLQATDAYSQLATREM